MPNTSSATWPALTAGARARASEVEAKFDFAEHHLWPHSAGTAMNNTYDLGNTTSAYWRTLWANSINATTAANGIAIGTTTANASSLLDIAGTRAVILPRMTTAERDALTPVNGMTIYNATTNQFQNYENGGWLAVGGAPQGLVAKVIAHTVSGTDVDVLNITGAGRLRSIRFLNQNAGFMNRNTLTFDSISTAQITATNTSLYYMLDTGITTGSFNATSTSGLVDTWFKSNLRVQHNSDGGAQTASTYVMYEKT